MQIGLVIPMQQSNRIVYANTDASNPNQDSVRCKIRASVMILLGKVALVALCVFCGAIAAADEYCAIRVNVELVDNRVRPIPFHVEDEQGRHIRKGVFQGQVIELCDLDGRALNIVVGFPGCNQTLIKGVRAEWPDTVNLEVLHQPCRSVSKYRIGPSGRKQCIVHLRVNPTTISKDNLAGTAGGKPILFDRFLRAWIDVEEGEQTELILMAPGFAEHRSLLPCGRREGIFVFDPHVGVEMKLREKSN